MNDTEKNHEENAGDQDENANAPGHLAGCDTRGAAWICADGCPAAAGAFDPISWAAPGDRTIPAPRCGVLERHDRHVYGPASEPIHCAGFVGLPADVAGYVASFQEWETENAAWLTKLGPLVHHARVLARKLDADDQAPVALSSAYLQAFTRLEKMRPASAGGAPSGDGLNPPGQQGSLFDPMED